MESQTTRDRILLAALELFATRSYKAASMRQIAEEVGITKASLYHHFRSKQEILEELLTPLLNELDAVLTRAAGERGLAARRRQLLEESADALLDHRHVLSLLLHDTSVYGDDGFELSGRIVAWTERASELLAGGRGHWKDRVRAAQALAALADPISLFPEVSADQLRPELLNAAFTLLGLPDA